MMRFLPFLFILLGAVVSGPAVALDVVSGGGGPEVRGVGNVAVFKLSPREIWVVTEEGRQGQMEVRNGWEMGPLRVSKGVGVRLKGPEKKWVVLKKGNAFTVRVLVTGETVARGKSAPSALSLIALRDGEVVGDKGVAVSDEEGHRFYVNPQGDWAVGLKAADVLAGGVVAVDFMAVKMAEAKLAEISPASGGGGLKPLKGVDTPVGALAVESENLAPMGEPVGLVYTPGEMMTFVMPDGFRLVNGAVIRSGDVRNVDALMALEDLENQVENLNVKPETVVPPPVKEVKKEVHHEAPPEPETRDLHAEVTPATPEAHGPEPVVVREENVPAREPGWLPDVGYGKDIQEHIIDAERATAFAEGAPALMAARRALAKTLLSAGRPHEALGVMALVTPTQVMDELTTGVAKVLRGMPREAILDLKDIGGVWRPHAELWQATALSESGNFTGAVKMWPDHKNLLPTYDSTLRDRILLARAEALLAVGGATAARPFIEEVLSGRERISPAWLYLRGRARLGAGETREGLEDLAAASEQRGDLKTAYLAKYDFIQALLARREIEPRQMVDYLEDLRMDWRGDTLEQRVLRDLGKLYVRRGDYRDGLNRWKTLVRAYPTYADMASLTREMSDAVMEAFKPENDAGFTPLEFIGLYEDFRELVPDDVRGTRIAERVAQLMTEATLYERAVPLLDNVLRYRTPKAPIDRARVALMLARAKRLQGLPQDSLRLLEAYDDDVTNSVLREAWQVEQGHVLVDLEQYDRAREIVANLRKPAAESVRLNAAWGEENWPRVTESAEKILDLPATTRPEDVTKVALLRGAFAHLMLGEGDKIGDMIKKASTELEAMPKVADALRSMAAMQGLAFKADGSEGPLGRFADTLAEINQLANAMVALKDYQVKSRAEQAEYNEKMRFMELLPPPAF
ncbi:MAG: hypothetical protein COY40_02530 [Alphaproteobacteria bacterium CG_4_10_14_0_8_um_filter_53_9]|nr:MAG: hypothetical protein COY40_02530 [Alphaproteobacteria bacterium CG_4_10_14_0_8_um_filter_53_9]